VWPLAQTQEIKLQVYENKAFKMFKPKRREASDQFRLLHNEEACSMYN